MLRKILRCCLKVVLIPIFILLKMMKGLCNLIQLFSGWLLRLLGLITLATAVACWLFRIEGTSEVIRMGIVGVGVFALPVIGELIIAGIMLLEILVKQAISKE